VGVSGGADSVALLRLLAALNASTYWRCTLVVGHMDHGLRGEASTADARFVRKLARVLELRCEVKKLKLPRGSSEDAARQARLKAFAQLAGKHQCAGVVLGHHADDHAETVLMKLFRGSGLDGLAGISPVSEVEGLRLYRPLLDVRREELRKYLEGIGQGWCEDATNGLPRFTRNRIRAELLPLIEQIAPQAVPAMRRMSRIVEEARHPIRDAVHTIWQAAGTVERRGRRVTFPRQALRTWNAVAAEVLRRAVEQVGGTSEIADAERIRQAVRLIKEKAGGKVVEMGRGVVVRIGGEVVIERRVAHARRGA
jgi:tRNA(Ile)-lysidine synthase